MILHHVWGPQFDLDFDLDPFQVKFEPRVISPGVAELPWPTLPSLSKIEIVSYSNQSTLGSRLQFIGRCLALSPLA